MKHISTVPEIIVNKFYASSTTKWIGILFKRYGRIECRFWQICFDINEGWWLNEDGRPESFPKVLVSCQEESSFHYKFCDDYHLRPLTLFPFYENENINWVNQIAISDDGFIEIVDNKKELTKKIEEAEYFKDSIYKLKNNEIWNMAASLPTSPFDFSSFRKESLKRTENMIKEKIKEAGHMIQRKALEDYFKKREEECAKIPDTEYKEQKSYVYLMKDKKTNLYKIGKSIKPEHREKTLQSEKPSIAMVFNREETDTFSERVLHKRYESQRVRGEWFDLTPAQVRYICRK